MPPTLTATHIAATVEMLCALIARHGHLRRLAGPLVVLIWQKVRHAGAQAGAVLARMQAGTLRRYPHRRPSRPRAAPRRSAAPGVLPRTPAWLVGLIPEAASGAAQLQNLLSRPDLPALLEAAPQLRRALRPLCRMLGVALPPQPRPAQTQPQAPPDSGAVALPTAKRAVASQRRQPPENRFRPPGHIVAGSVWPPPPVPA
jgi:hypothetical protein